MLGHRLDPGLSESGAGWWPLHLHALRGSWVVISGVISPLLWVISIATLLLTLLIASPESRVQGFESWVSGLWPRDSNVP